MKDEDNDEDKDEDLLIDTPEQQSVLFLDVPQEEESATSRELSGCVKVSPLAFS